MFCEEVEKLRKQSYIELQQRRINSTLKAYFVLSEGSFLVVLMTVTLVMIVYAVSYK